MNLSGTLALFLLAAGPGYAQNPSANTEDDRKGYFYFYVGWNRGWYSNSDISFHGNNYDFTLKSVVAKDWQSKFDPSIYFNPVKFTIPQTNVRLGYFIEHNYAVSFGIDHMKYVVKQDQVVKISGQIKGTQTDYDGTYSNDDIIIKDDFLKFEHTDGLNYINTDVRRFDKIIDLKKVTVNMMEGFGIGALLPRTNATLLDNARNDKFHLSGFGLNGVAGMNVTFYKIFFIQTELKGGFISMPSIRTTNSKADKASQSFLFTQLNYTLGATFKFKKKIKSSE